MVGKFSRRRRRIDGLMDQQTPPRLIDDAPDRLANALSRRRRQVHLVASAFSIAILALSVVVLLRTFAAVKWSDLRAALASTGWDQIAVAGLFTTVSYLALTGYDALALRQLRLKVPYGRTALASFTSYAISFTLGFPLITAGTVRYWIYSQSGLTAGKVLSLTLIAGITFWLGMALVIGVALVVDPAGVADIDQLKAQVNVVVGLCVLAAIALWLARAARGLRGFTIQGVRLELPGFWPTAGQMALGVIDVCSAAAVLYALLPRQTLMNFVDFAATYAFACLLGIASNAPGGLGAFEMTMLKSTPAPSPEGMIASLLMFRMIYYLIPFVLAMALLGAHEAIRRWASLRADMGRRDDNNET